LNILNSIELSFLRRVCDKEVKKRWDEVDHPEGEEPVHGREMIKGQKPRIINTYGDI